METHQSRTQRQSLCSECECVLLASGTPFGDWIGNYVRSAARTPAARTARQQLDPAVGRPNVCVNPKLCRVQESLCSQECLTFLLHRGINHRSGILGRRLESATAPQLYSLRTEFDLRHWTNVWEGCSGSTKRKSGDRPDANPRRIRLRWESRRAF